MTPAILYTNLTVAQAGAGAVLLDDTTEYYSTPLTMEPTTGRYYIWDNDSGTGTLGQQQNNASGTHFMEANFTRYWRLWDSDNEYTVGQVPGWAGLKHECIRGGAGSSSAESLSYLLPWLLKSQVAFTPVSNTATNGVDPLPCGNTMATSTWNGSSGSYTTLYRYQRADANKGGTNWTIQSGVNSVLEPATLNFADGTQSPVGPWSYHWSNYTSNDWGFLGIGAEQHASPNFYMMPNNSDQNWYNLNNNDHWGLWNGTEWGAQGKCSDVGGCTVEGTVIQMMDGTEKHVQDIKVGDKLKTMSNKNVPQTDNFNSLWTFNYEGTLNFDYVETTVVKNEIYVVNHIFIFIMEGGHALRTSWDHINMIKRHNVWKFMMSKFISKGDTMLDSNNIERTIHEVKIETGTFNTYHLDVEENDMYIANGILTHNASNKSSDIRLKENIVYVGLSESGIPIYVFSYIGCAIRYIGTMAQDLLRLGRKDAVSVMRDGYYAVNYNKLDVSMIELNKRIKI